MREPEGDAVATTAAGRLLYLLFFTSGAVALSAEVVLERLLTYVFGASHLATATVLAAYMAGLSLGSAAVGRFTPRIRRPIAAYGYFEMGVGLFLALAPALYRLLDGPGMALARSWAGHGPALTAARFAFAFLFVLVPTVLMGGTLPLLVSAGRGARALRTRLPRLYATNTFGAAAGTIASAYVLVPSLGLDGTLYAGALANAAVGLAALALSRREGPVSPAEPGVERAAPPAVPEPRAPGLSPGLVCSLAFAQGALAFVLEVTWAHLIGTVIGVTVYAFALMLAAILIGIGLGSVAAPRLLRRGLTPVAVAALGQLAATLGVASSLFAWDRFPDVVALALRLRPEWSFAAREAVRFTFAVALLVPTTIGLGASLPMLAASVSGRARGAGSAGSWVGLVFGANTVGAIAGSLLAGFVLLGRVSSARILVCASAAALVLAIAVAARGARAGALSRSRRLTTALVAGGAAAGALILGFPGWNTARLTAGSHYYWTPAPAPPPAILSVLEDPQTGFVTVEEAPDGARVVKTNGKYEGSSAELEFQDHVASLGALYLRRFRRSALVGLGPGRTLALLHELPFERIEIVEFSRAMVETARAHFPEFAGPALRDAGRVALVLDDGRGHLQSSPHRYDYVAVAITGAAFAGVGSLYTEDFFRAVRSRLEREGVFLLWVQLHHVRPRDVRSVVLTLSRAFPHVHMYATPDGGQGYLVASGAPLAIDPTVVRGFERSPRLRAIMDAAHMQSLLELSALNVFSTPEEILAYAAGLGLPPPRPIVFTDFRPGFEYATPYGLAEPSADHQLQRWSRGLLPRFVPELDEYDRARLAALRRYVAEAAGASSR
jgi:spermidine synthase